MQGKVREGKAIYRKRSERREKKNNGKEGKRIVNMKQRKRKEDEERVGNVRDGNGKKYV